jgi:hypothetical protein
MLVALVLGACSKDDEPDAKTADGAVGDAPSPIA